MKTWTDREIARVIHATVRDMQSVLGDPSPAPPWESVPGDVKAIVIANVAYAREGGTARGIHEAWLTDMEKRGFTLGPVKDYDAKTHPCMLPYDMLADFQRDKCRAFVGLVRILTRDMM